MFKHEGAGHQNSECQDTGCVSLSCLIKPSCLVVYSYRLQVLSFLSLLSKPRIVFRSDLAIDIDCPPLHVSTRLQLSQYPTFIVPFRRSRRSTGCLLRLFCFFIVIFPSLFITILSIGVREPFTVLSLSITATIALASLFQRPSDGAGLG
ncbi:hypothetical protein BKA70DRAFT_361273 [Coprinopsis sp. MPI-PUGE-AT-0042]|nr:hypothetical protein BKA70DRAFT_361273 [Coprinopsis sp. MPI-PUGE-AT-0042]